GPILKIEVSAGTSNVGPVALAQDKKRIIWNIGTKFPRNLEATLNAVVLFGNKITDKVHVDDEFCIGKNAYAQIRFKINSFTFSSCQLDPHSVNTSPNAHYKSNYVTEFAASQYRIWNSFGDAPIALTQNLQNEVSEKKLSQQY
ncbi:uncharacterized protein TRIADDRAFT_62867, partial [Trichoplax adhaerens]